MTKQTRPASGNPNKHAHRLPPQTCLLWIPDLKGFLSTFTGSKVDVTDMQDIAMHVSEEKACRLAMLIWKVTGMKAAVRAYHPHSFQAA